MSLINELAQFTGTQGYTKGFMDVKMTDGVVYFADKASWAITDISVILRMVEKVRVEPFISIKIIVKDNKGHILYTNGNGKELYKQEYTYIDLENGTYDLYYINKVLLLSSEY